MKPKFLFRITTQSLICFLLALTFMTGCGIKIQPVEAPLQPPAFTPSSNVMPMHSVPVVFNARLAHFQGANLSIAIDILDDVTGIDVRASRYPMQPVDEFNYTATIDLPEYGETRYRYVLTSNGDEIETDGVNQRVLFRNMYVNPNTTISDMIFGWASSPYHGEYGRVEGAVTDLSTSKTVADVMITIAGKTIYSDKTGRFHLSNVPVGVHRLTASSINGAYRIFEQDVNVVAGLSTPAVVKLEPLSEVKVTFMVKPPNDAVGAPIRIAGNFYQFGNVFPYAGGSRKPAAVRLPLMEMTPDGHYTLQLKLFAGSEIRYKYTMGDGFVNAERNAEGQRVTRRLIVPSKDIEINDEIVSWRESGKEPASITVKLNSALGFEDWVSLRVEGNHIHSTLPIWPIGNNQWMYLLYENPDEPLEFSVCRNDLCNVAFDLSTHNSPRKVDFTNPDNNFTEVNEWSLWNVSQAVQLPTGNSHAPDGENLVGVEFTHVYKAGFLKKQIDVLERLYEAGINWLILTPTWKVQLINGLPFFSVDVNTSASLADLGSVVAAAKKLGMSVGVYPQLIFENGAADWWQSSIRDQLWWQQWYFEYERFVMNFAIFAEEYKVDQLIIGGSAVQPSFPDELVTNERSMGTPKSSEEVWGELILKLKKSYKKDLLWTIPARGGNLPTYKFLDQVDGYYLEVDSNSPDNATYSLETVSKYMDSMIVNFQSLHKKPFFLGLNSPSLQSYRNDAGDSERVISPFAPGYGQANVAIDSQTYFYEVYASVARERPWIYGIASRGFFPVAELLDFSSSVFGKPALLELVK